VVEPTHQFSEFTGAPYEKSCIRFVASVGSIGFVVCGSVVANAYDRTIAESQERRWTANLPGRKIRRISGSKDQLGRERVRDRNLDSSHRERRMLSADQLKEIEYQSAVVAGFKTPGICFRPRGQASDLFDCARWWGSASVDHK